MTITRLVHSCLLIENNGLFVVVDPGNFSYGEERVKPAELPRIDYIVITHEHDDHCWPEFIQEILVESPKAQIIGNSEVSAKLEASNIKSSFILPEFMTAQSRKHAALWQNLPRPENTVFTLWNQITLLGDNREIDQVACAETIAFPIVAPWGSLVDAIDRLIANPPKRVIPIHDWHLSNAGKLWYQQRMVSALEPAGIEVLQMGDTDSVDI